MILDTSVVVSYAECFCRFVRLFLVVLGVWRLADFGHLLVILQIDVVFDSCVVHLYCCIVGKVTLIALFYYCLLTDCSVFERIWTVGLLELLHAAFCLTPVRILTTLLTRFDARKAGCGPVRAWPLVRRRTFLDHEWSCLERRMILDFCLYSWYFTRLPFLLEIPLWVQFPMR